MSKIIENFTKQDLRDGMICITKDNSRLIKIGNSLRSIKTGNVATLVDKYRPDLSRTQISDDYLIIMKITYGDEVIFDRKETLTERIKSALPDGDYNIFLTTFNEDELWTKDVVTGAKRFRTYECPGVKGFCKFAYDCDDKIIFNLRPVITFNNRRTIQPIAAIFYKDV